MTHDELLEKIRDTAYSVHNGHTIALDRIVNQLHALHKVVELHNQEADNTCAECWDAGDDWRLAYPCPTIQAIQEQLK